MSKNKFYTLFIIGLIISNIILLGFMLMAPPPPPKKQDRKKIVIERLNFDEQQVEAYKGLIKVHRTDVESREEGLRIAKEALYAQLPLAPEDSQKDSLLTTITTLQAEIEAIHYNHFADIKNLCTEAQLKDFEALAKDLAKIFAPKGAKKK
ncbi:MAG: periplasmic heavy metal sensor [Aureispira sp.]|nr:periplasmic heavy metal sensor [Aureispira sp.]